METIGEDHKPYFSGSRSSATALNSKGLPFNLLTKTSTYSETLRTPQGILKQPTQTQQGGIWSFGGLGLAGLRALGLYGVLRVQGFAKGEISPLYS